MANEKILNAIYDAVDEINELNPEEQQIQKDVNAVLFGESANLDSLGLVNLVVAAEQNLEEALGVDLTLADEKAMSQRRSPFRTIGTLAEYVETLLKEETDE